MTTMKTLSEVLALTGDRAEELPSGCVAVESRLAHDPRKGDYWLLSDYTVSSVVGGNIFLLKPKTNQTEREQKLWATEATSS